MDRLTGNDFVISRVFDAPRQIVWTCFTDPEHLKQWWGPKGFKVLQAKLDLRAGGSYHYGMQAPDGQEMWGKFVYRDVTPPGRLVFINSFSDPEGGITRHPGAEDWPLEMLSTFSFDELPDAKTMFTVRWAPHNASDAERKVFDDNRPSMTAGWNGTMEQLEAYLPKVRREAA